MADLIKYSDSLRKGTDKLNDSIKDSNTAFLKANQAAVISEAAKILAESVQEQFNQVVIEGDSSVEAAQARVNSSGVSHPTLKSRLDNFEFSASQQLAEKADISVFEQIQDIVETQESVNLNTIKRFNNIYVDITQPPYNVPIDPAIDATDAIQNAFDTVPIRSKILLPKGTYKITKPLIVSRELTIEGSGSGENGGTLIDVHFPIGYAENYAIIMRQSAKNGRMRNIYIRNSSKEINGLFGIGNTPSDGALTHYEFENIWSVGFTAGFDFYNIYLSTFRACYAIGGYYGFMFVGHSTSLIFEKCYANKNTDNWYIQNIIYSTFISCASDSASRYGYYIDNVDSVTFLSCGAEGCGRTGFYLNDSNSVTIQSFFAVGCGESTAAGLGASGHIESNNSGTIINGFFERSMDPNSPRTTSLVVTSKDNDSSVTGAVVTKGVYTTPNVLLNGQRRSNLQPTNGTHKRGDFVFNTGSETNILGWKCTADGSPGTWVVVNV